MVFVYRLIGDNNLFGDILEQTLKNRKIKDIGRFISPSKEDEIHFSNLLNIDKAIELFDRHLKNISSIIVVIDSDADGFCSGSIFVQYIRKNFPHIEITYLMHEARTNGLTVYMMKKILESSSRLVVLPDSGSNDFEQHKTLKDNGIDVLVLDHHTCEKESEHAVVVNPQLCLDTYPNENLAAGGIVYRFLQAMDVYYNLNDADSYLDLVAISSIADAMDMTEKETRYYVKKGLGNIQNPFIKQLIYKNAGWAKEIFPLLVSFQIANFINAIIRVGDLSEKEIIFRAMLGEEENTTRISKYRGVEREVTETLPELSYRLCVNARSRQNRLKKKLTDEAVLQVSEKELDKNAFIIVELDDVPSGFSGFVASGIAGVYRKPTLVVSHNATDNLYVGSLRGHPASPVVNVKSFLEGLELFEFIRGHEGASGLAITKKNLLLLDEVINSKLQFSSESNSMDVDFEINSKSLTEGLINEVSGLAKHFGKGCDEPLFAITDLELRCADGVYKNTMKFTKGNIEIMSFDVDQRLVDLAEENMIANVSIVATLSLNHFLGKATPQVMIKSLRINSTKEDSFGGFVF